MNEKLLNQIATALAYEKFENQHGFGLYHASPQTIEAAIDTARKEVDTWVNRLSPVFEQKDSNEKTFTREEVRNILLGDSTYEKVDDRWGSSGWSAVKWAAELFK